MLDGRNLFIPLPKLPIVNESAVGLHRLGGDALHQGLHGRAAAHVAFGVMGGLQHCIDDLFKMPAGNEGPGITKGDHFALFRKPHASTAALDGDSENGLIGTTAAASHAAAPAVEEAHLDIVLPAHFR